MSSRIIFVCDKCNRGEKDRPPGVVRYETQTGRWFDPRLYKQFDLCLACNDLLHKFLDERPEWSVK